MKNYEKPVVMVNEGLAEGVYAASGEPGHWEVTSAKKEQTFADYALWTFRITCIKDNVDDESNKGVTLGMSFNTNVDVEVQEAGGFGAIASSSGSSVTINFVNGYCRYDQSQNMDCKVKIYPANAELIANSFSYGCMHP